MIDETSTIAPPKTLAGMTRKQIRKLIKQRRGEIARIAERTGRSQSVVSEWFTGRNSSPIVGAEIYKTADKILTEEGRKEVAISGIALPSA